MPAGHIYIMGSPSGTLYIGVTSAFDVRIHQHKNGTFEGFSKTYGCTRLLYSEKYDDIRTAIAREKQLKAGAAQRNSTSSARQTLTSKTLQKNWAGRSSHPTNESSPSDDN